MRLWVVFGLSVLLTLAGCTQGAAPQPTKPVAQPPAAATSEPAKPAAQQPTAAPAQASKPASQPVVELRIGAGDAEDGLNSKAMQKFAQLINEKSKGEISARVFSMSLGSEQTLVPNIMNGSVDIGQCSNGNIGRFTDAFFLFDLPFMFKSYDNALKATTSPTARKLIDMYEKDLGVKHLFSNSYGTGRDIQTAKKQVKRPADIKGIKIRTVATPVDLAIFQAWGANPTPVEFSQLYAALQQGIVEGMQNSYMNLIPMKHHEVLKYNLRIEYQPIFELNFMNAKKLASLSPQHQKVILDSAAEAQQWNWDTMRSQAAGVLKQLQDFGMIVYTPTPEERAEWTSVREKVWTDVAEQQKGKIDLDLARQLYEKD